MSKPIQIPRDLTAGAIIRSNDGMSHKFLYYDITHEGHHCAACDTGAAFKPNGRRLIDDNEFAVRIIRKVSKPAKVKMDKDAEWLRELSNTVTLIRERRRLRRIAKRLEKQP